MHLTKVLTLIFILIVSTNGTPDTKKHRFKRESEETVELTAEEKKKYCESKHTCEDCVSIHNYQCFWCSSTGNCTYQHTPKVLPSTDDCNWKDKRWVVCWLDYRALVICIAVIGGVTLIMVLCCLVRLCTCIKDCFYLICCCECFNCSARASERRSNRQIKRLEKEMRRQSRRQELMMKYGNSYGASGSVGTYNRFEDTKT